ncbi:MAG: ATP-binding protein [Candidatus Magasanikbacteria bacterium]|nr:ATP-binding protein [Candidatus Magasanikbacteria bacterium]
MYYNSKNRSILAKIIQQLNNDLILILIGPRQTGKTTLQKMLIEYLHTKQPRAKTFYFDMEIPDNLKHFSDYKTIHDFLVSKGMTSDITTMLFLDEFQKIPTPTKTLKILHDHYPYLKIIATGSSSLTINKSLRDESAAGRKRIFHILPLDFSEYLDFRNLPEQLSAHQNILQKNLDTSAADAETKTAWEQFAVWGGYPRVAIHASDEEKRASLQEIQSAYLERDIAKMIPESELTAFIKFTSLLSAQSSGLFNINEISKISSVSRFKTDKYVFLLEQSFIIHTIKPFFNNKQKELIKMPKLFFLDTGLRNHITQNFAEPALRADKGQLMENAVYVELLKYLPAGATIQYWRTAQGAEVDFVVRKDNETIPVEVKYQPFQKPTVPSGLKSFIEQYNPPRAFVITRDYSAHTKYHSCEVLFLPAYFTEKIFL